MTKQHAYTQMRRIAPTVDNGNAYADGDMIGTAEELLSLVVNEGNGIVLQTITVVDLSNQKSDLILWFFDTELSNTTFNNNGALDIHDTDMLRCVGHVLIEDTDYRSAADNAVATVRNVGLSMLLNSKNLWVVVMSAGSPTYATGELQIGLTFWQD